MCVEATVEDDVLNWRYVAGSNEWKQSVPLYKMLPHPIISIDRGTRWKYLAMVVLLPLLGFAVVDWLDFGPVTRATIPVLLFVMLAYRFSPWLIGPIEWASFDTTLNDKTVYVFRGDGDSGFDEFVASLDDAIQAASQYADETRVPGDTNGADE